MNRYETRGGPCTDAITVWDCKTNRFLRHWEVEQLLNEHEQMIQEQKQQREGDDG